LNPVALLASFGTSVETVLEASKIDDAVEGRVLLLDADSICYHATFDCAKLETAQRRAVTKVYEAMYLTKASHVRVYTTPEGCWKNGRRLLNAVNVYQFSRSAKTKPPLLQELRNSFPTLFADDPQVTVIASMDIEADDAIIIDAHVDKNYVVWSEDKDLNLTPSVKYEIKTGRMRSIADTYGWLAETTTPAGKLKIDGHGTKFFWCQMLMGDSADNVKGIQKYKGKLCGPAGALNALVDIQSESAAANLVIMGYSAISQNILPEAEALWLLRTRDDSALKYIWSLDLNPEARAYITHCTTLPLYMTEEQYIERTNPEWQS